MTRAGLYREILFPKIGNVCTPPSKNPLKVHHYAKEESRGNSLFVNKEMLVRYTLGIEMIGFDRLL